MKTCVKIIIFALVAIAALHAIFMLILIAQCADTSDDINEERVVVSAHINQTVLSSVIQNALLERHMICSDLDVPISTYKLQDMNIRSLRATILVPTSTRWSLLLNFVKIHGDMWTVQKIVIVWNNLAKSAPNPYSLWRKEVAEKVVFVSRNYYSPVTRLYYHEEIETDAVLIMDDDMIANEYDIKVMLDTLSFYPSRLIGGFARHHLGSMYFSTKAGEKYSMVITKMLMLHVNVLKLFTCNVPETMIREITARTNCEDIALNFVVSNATGEPPLVSRLTEIYDYGTRDGISSHSSHSYSRIACLSDFQSIYGDSCLKYTSHVVSSSLERRSARPLGMSLYLIWDNFVPNKASNVYLDKYGQTRSVLWLRILSFVKSIPLKYSPFLLCPP